MFLNKYLIDSPSIGDPHFFKWNEWPAESRVHRACQAGGGGLESLAGFQFLGICEMHSARFGSPYAKVLPRNHFILKKMGVSDAMEPTLFMCKNLTGKYCFWTKRRIP